mgnify:CR=1 FL=1
MVSVSLVVWKIAPDNSNLSRSSNELVRFYIYFARPDSVIDGISVHESRMKAGELLAESYPKCADIVIGVPDSGLDAALGYAGKSGIPYGIRFSSESISVP